jgi:class 3 adenylate cyclase
MADTGKREKRQVVECTVMVFDICSSTVFIEDLVKTDELDSYCKLLEDFLIFLKVMKIDGMTIYKFIGDGFVLLFDKKVPFDEVLTASGKIALFAKRSV